jgi:hypothetical protein
MGSPGYVYLLINYSMPGLVKVGMTTRATLERVGELSSATGVPIPFQLVHDILVPDCEAAESHLHALLSDRGYRLTDNREFFQAPIHEVVALMIQVQAAVPRSSMVMPRTGGVAGPVDSPEPDAMDSEEMQGERDGLYEEAARLCLEAGESSTSFLQRRLQIGYGRAARIFDQLRRTGALARLESPEGDNSESHSTQAKPSWRFWRR